MHCAPGTRPRDAGGCNGSSARRGEKKDIKQSSRLIIPATRLVPSSGNDTDADRIDGNTIDERRLTESTGRKLFAAEPSDGLCSQQVAAGNERWFPS